MNGAYNGNFLGASPLNMGQKVKYHLITKIFFPNFVCFLTNERCRTYQTGFSLFCLGHASGMGLWGAGGDQGVNFFFKHGHAAFRVGIYNGAPSTARSSFK